MVVICSPVHDLPGSLHLTRLWSPLWRGQGQCVMLSTRPDGNCVGWPVRACLLCRISLAISTRV